MTTRNEGARTGDLILKEAPNRFSREEVTIAAGADLRPGSVLGLVTATGKYVLHSPAATDGSQTPIAVLARYAHAASADVRSTVISREAKLLQTALVFHADVKTVAQRKAAIAALALRRILAKSPTLVSVLDLIEWNSAAYPIKFWKSGNTWFSDFDRRRYFPDSRVVNKVYVDRVNGASGNSGASFAAAKSAPHMGVTLGNAGGQPFGVVLKPGMYPRGASLNSNGSIFPTQDMMVTVEGGRATITTHDDLAWPTTKDATYPAWTRVARSNVARVVDLIHFDTNGDYLPIDRATDATDGAAGVSSYAQVGGDLLIKRSDGLVPTNANTRVYLRGAGSPIMLDASSSGRTIYLRDLDIEGGADIGTLAAKAAALNVTIIAENCTFKYGGDDSVGLAVDGVAIAGSGLVVLDRCVVSSATKDGFNGHQATDAVREAFLLSLNSIIRGVGKMASAMSCNTFTLHEGAVGIVMGGILGDSRGGNVRHIGKGRALLLGVQIGPDKVGGGIEPAALRVDDDAVIYGIDLKLTVGDPSHYAAVAVGAGRIFLRNVDTGGGIIQGAERMPDEVNVAA